MGWVSVFLWNMPFECANRRLRQHISINSQPSKQWLSIHLYSSHQICIYSTNKYKQTCSSSHSIPCYVIHETKNQFCMWIFRLVCILHRPSSNNTVSRTWYLCENRLMRHVPIHTQHTYKVNVRVRWIFEEKKNICSNHNARIWRACRRYMYMSIR